jgi:hypothetical protein
MNIKLSQLVNSVQVLNKIFNSDKLPVTDAYRLSKSINKIQDELQNFDKFRIELIKKYGQETGDGNYQVKPEFEDDFKKGMDELLNTEVEIGLNPVTLESLSKVNLSAIELSLIDYLIEEQKV